MKKVLTVMLAAALLSGCQTLPGDANTLKDCVCEGQKSSRELVHFKYSASLRRVNGSIDIRADCAGNLFTRISSFDDGDSNFGRTLTDTEIDRLKAELEAVDWAHAVKDEVSGLDGSTVHLNSGDREAKLWAPEASARERGLEELQRVVETLFEYAGLDGNGLAKES